MVGLIKSPSRPSTEDNDQTLHTPSQTSALKRPTLKLTRMHVATEPWLEPIKHLLIEIYHRRYMYTTPKASAAVGDFGDQAYAAHFLLQPDAVAAETAAGLWRWGEMIVFRRPLFSAWLCSITTTRSRQHQQQQPWSRDANGRSAHNVVTKRSYG